MQQEANEFQECVALLQIAPNGKAVREVYVIARPCVPMRINAVPRSERALRIEAAGAGSDGNAAAWSDGLLGPGGVAAGAASMLDYAILWSPTDRAKLVDPPEVGIRCLAVVFPAGHATMGQPRIITARGTPERFLEDRIRKVLTKPPMDERRPPRVGGKL